MSDSTTKIVSLALQLKEGSYTRVENDFTQTRLYAVDQQGAPRKENIVKAWQRIEEMVLCFKRDEDDYLLKVDGNELKLEKIFDKPNIASLTKGYWFRKEKAAVSEQYRIHSQRSPELCLIIKEDEDNHRLIDLDNIKTTTYSIAVFIMQEKIYR